MMIVKKVAISLVFWGSVLLGNCCFAMEGSSNADAFKAVLASGAKTIGTPGTIKVVLTINFGWLNNKNFVAYFDSLSSVGDAIKNLKGSAQLLGNISTYNVRLKQGAWYWKTSETINDGDKRLLGSLVGVGGTLMLSAQGKRNSRIF